MSSGIKPDSERKTIGVFASQVGRAWGSEFITGITDAAEAQNVNVVHFIGGTLRPTTLCCAGGFGFDWALASRLRLASRARSQ